MTGDFRGICDDQQGPATWIWFWICRDSLGDLRDVMMLRYREGGMLQQFFYFYFIFIFILFLYEFILALFLHTHLTLQYIFIIY